MQCSVDRRLSRLAVLQAAFGTKYKNITIDVKGVPTLFAKGGWAPSPDRFKSENASFGGSTLYVQTNASLFCMEPVPAHWNETTGSPIQVPCTANCHPNGAAW